MRYIIFLFLIIADLGVGLGQTLTKDQRFAGCWTGVDAVINHYADSLNFVTSDRHLPIFLTDYIMDWNHEKHLRSCLRDSFEVVSFRKVILNRVYREDVLEWIISSKDSTYDKLYIPEQLRKEIQDAWMFGFPNLPYMKYSWRVLAKMRLEEIKQVRESMKR